MAAESPKPIYEIVKAALVERGWTIDPNARESRIGELYEFVHPETGRAFPWIDAILEQASRELDEGDRRSSRPAM